VTWVLRLGRGVVAVGGRDEVAEGGVVVEMVEAIEKEEEK
jgi:hypothetical protein